MSTITLDLSEARQPQSEAAKKAVALARGAGGIKRLLHGRTDVYQVSPYDIRVEKGWNIRDFSTPENQQHVADLAHSINAQGVQVPLRGYIQDGTLWLTDGESRLRAVFHALNVLGAEIFTVPIQLEPRNTDEPHRVLGQLVRNSGKPLTPLERAKIVARLLEHGWAEEQIATESGLTLMRIRQLRELLTLPEAVQQQVQSGAIAATEAVRVVQQHGDAAPEVVERAVRLSSENGGAKAGRATAKTLRAVTREPEPPGPDENEFSSELESALKENADLCARIEALSGSDTGRTIAGLQAQNAALNGRNQQMTKELGDLKRERDAHAKRLEKIRGLLGVERNADIEDAIRTLVQMADDARLTHR